MEEKTGFRGRIQWRRGMWTVSWGGSHPPPPPFSPGQPQADHVGRQHGKTTTKFSKVPVPCCLSWQWTRPERKQTPSEDKEKSKDQDKSRTRRFMGRFMSITEGRRDEILPLLHGTKEINFWELGRIGGLWWNLMNVRVSTRTHCAGWSEGW